MNRDSLAIPLAIVVAAAFVAGAIYFSGSKDAPATGTLPTPGASDEAPVVAPVTDADHIRGNPNAPIVLVEYSDFDCPFCQQFHQTLTRIIDEYGPTGKVAWVYRQFPLVQLHPNAPKISEASECVAELGGNDAFWKFTDAVNTRAVNAPTDMARLPEFAQNAGVDRGAFETCLNSGKYTEKIAQDIQAAIAAGGTGTPHTIVMVGGQTGAINGAQPYDVVKQIIDNLITQIDAGTL